MFSSDLEKGAGAHSSIQQLDPTYLNGREWSPPAYDDSVNENMRSFGEPAPQEKMHAFHYTQGPQQRKKSRYIMWSLIIGAVTIAAGVTGTVVFYTNRTSQKDQANVSAQNTTQIIMSFATETKNVAKAPVQTRSESSITAYPLTTTIFLTTAAPTTSIKTVVIVPTESSTFSPEVITVTTTATPSSSESPTTITATELSISTATPSTSEAPTTITATEVSVTTATSTAPDTTVTSTSTLNSSDAALSASIQDALSKISERLTVPLTATTTTSNESTTSTSSTTPTTPAPEPTSTPEPTPTTMQTVSGYLGWCGVPGENC